jgi:hypothetical protein
MTSGRRVEKREADIMITDCRVVNRLSLEIKPAGGVIGNKLTMSLRPVSWHGMEGKGRGTARARRSREELG